MDRFVHESLLFRSGAYKSLLYRRELLDALHKRGFRTNQGIHGTGLFMLAFSKAGGYYLGTWNLYSHSCSLSHLLLDVGASQLIADGKIKLKNDSQIKEFTETGLLFENGSELTADVVVFATGWVHAANRVSVY